MRFAIQNINKIHQADILLDGLTVIVGENDTGKSTVGRLLFSVIKSLENVKSVNEKNKQQQLRKFISSLNKRLRSCGVFQTYSIAGRPELASRVAMFFPRTLTEFYDMVSEMGIEEFKRQMHLNIDKLDTATPRLKSLMKNDILNISVSYQDGDKRAASLFTEFNYLAESEFLNQMDLSESKERLVELIGEDNTSYFTLSVSHDGKRTQCEDKESLSEVTYVESPLYLHLLELIGGSVLYRETARKKRTIFGMAPYHIRDFAAKIQDSHYTSYDLFRPETSLDTKGLLDGAFYFDQKKNAILFKRGDMLLYPLNVASGIKSFGVLQLLLDGGYVSANSPLIWDEPENHLHPAWQIEFAKLLVQIAKSGAPLLITTHSPYFLQAIRYYAAAEQLEEYVHYYSAESATDGMVDMVEVTNNLSEVFHRLAAPLAEVMNVDAIRKGIKLP